MCLIGFRWHPGVAIPLLVAANRDEFYERPTAPMAWWEGGQLLAGRDLKAGGTWLGLTRTGRFAALTNHRDPTLVRPEGPSRGRLPLAFLEGEATPERFLEGLRQDSGASSPYNLLLCDGTDLVGYESRGDRVVRFEAGVHAVANGAFNEPWPKVTVLKDSLAVAGDDLEALLAALQDELAFPDASLPHTGVSLDWERALSPRFIRTPTYGTRASTVLALGRRDVAVIERTFTAQGREGERRFEFVLTTASAGTTAKKEKTN